MAHVLLNCDERAHVWDHGFLTPCSNLTGASYIGSNVWWAGSEFSFRASGYQRPAPSSPKLYFKVHLNVLYARRCLTRCCLAWRISAALPCHVLLDSWHLIIWWFWPSSSSWGAKPKQSMPLTIVTRAILGSVIIATPYRWCRCPRFDDTEKPTCMIRLSIYHTPRHLPTPTWLC